MPFYIYLLVGDTSIASVVVQVYDRKEKVVFYLSRRMLDIETRYHEMEKLCLCLVFRLHKVVAHLALCRGNRYLQIGHDQAYAVGSYVERLAREMDVRADRI
jgi:hypothetical protein